MRVADVIAEHGPVVFGIAYRMLGSVADAEDIRQETFLRWHQHGGHVDEPRAWLATVATRLSIDRTRSAARRRVDYVGEWLPEPLAGPPEGSDDPVRAAELADSVTLAALVVLDRLDPVQRAVFLLHDVFGFEFAEVADVVGRRPDNCRQIARRARERIHDEAPPRQEVDAATGRRLVEALMDACVAGDVDGLRTLLADDVVLVSDGGPTRHAARRPVVGAERVARFFVNLAKRVGPGTELDITVVNGEPALVARPPEEAPIVIVLSPGPTGITGIHAVLAPEKVAGFVR